jgi:hypothetical protein
LMRSSLARDKSLIERSQDVSVNMQLEERIDGPSF